MNLFALNPRNFQGMGCKSPTLGRDKHHFRPQVVQGGHGASNYYWLFQTSVCKTGVQPYAKL